MGFVRSATGLTLKPLLRQLILGLNKHLTLLPFVKPSPFLYFFLLSKHTDRHRVSFRCPLFSWMLYRTHSAFSAPYQQGRWGAAAVLVPRRSLLRADRLPPPLLQQSRAPMFLRDELVINLNNLLSLETEGLLTICEASPHLYFSKYVRGRETHTRGKKSQGRACVINHDDLRYV